MVLTGPAHRTPVRPHTVTNTLGHLLVIALNGVFFYLVNVRPGWQASRFLTPETSQVLDLLNFLLITAIVINTVYLLYDALWFKALGDFVLAVISLAVLQRIWWVFPFAFTGWPVLLIRAVLVAAAVTTVMGMIANSALLVRHSAGKESNDE